ncbi:hypothetical protein ACWDR7_02775 [Microbacterium sp. NPDC003461]|jgi:hypothetical protein
MAFEHHHGADDGANPAAHPAATPATPLAPKPLTLVGGAHGAGMCAGGVCEIPEG